ncbi:MAG: HAMP domain-containing protein [Candidatus Kapaibacterium sp.]|nr:MAG: HAMP domain-containing protein [Candidatus Kapabacteria bacterium]
MKGLNFATKFALVLCATSLLAVGAIGYWLSVINLQTLELLSQNRYQVIAHDASARLSEKVRSIRVLLQEANDIFSNLELSNQAAQTLVVSALQRNTEIDAIGLYDVEGGFVDAIAKGENILPKRLPQQLVDTLNITTNVVIIGRVGQHTEGQAPMIPIAIRFERGDGSRGILACVLSGKDLSAFISQASKDAFGRKEQMYIVDDSLRLIAFHDMPTLMKQERFFGKGIFKEVKKPSQVVIGRDVSATKEYTSSDGREMVGTYITLPEIRALMGIEEPQALVYRSVNEMRRGVVVGLLAVGTAAIVISFAVARQLSRPINQLLEGSERIATQDFTFRLDENRSDEFGILFQSNNRVAGELARYQQMNLNKIVGTRNKLESVVRQASDGFIVIEPNRAIFVMNDVFAHWFGADATTAEGRSFLDVLNHYELKQTIMQAFVEEETHIPVQFTLDLVGEASETVVKGTFVRVMSEHQLTAVMGVLRDVTREVAVDRMKTELVSIVAHELRSPLNTIRGFSELIKKGLDADETQEFAGIISSEADRLNGVITKFLDINRIESGRTDLRKIPFRMHELVINVLKVNMPLAEARGMTVETEIPLSTTPIVGDPDLIGQVFLNLFSNAVKYSEANKTVRIEVVEGSDTMRVNVYDQGYGISESAKEKLFTKFFRAVDDERVRQHVGTGLGLAFIKEIVEKHGGEMGVESQLNVGSMFYFWLPK